MPVALRRRDPLHELYVAGMACLAFDPDSLPIDVAVERQQIFNQMPARHRNCRLLRARPNFMRWATINGRTLPCEFCVPEHAPVTLETAGD